MDSRYRRNEPEDAYEQWLEDESEREPEYGYLYPVDTVRMTIIQPRLDNISTFKCSREELEAWGESIRPIARLAYEGKGEQKPGDWCRFCRARPVCRACVEEAMSLAREEFLDLDAALPSEGVLTEPTVYARMPAV